MPSTAPANSQITINGQPRPLGEMQHVAHLMEALGLDARKVAVELNRAIVPRSAYATTPLNAGDRVEIVGFIGGG